VLKESKDLRRAYEHLGRIESLQTVVPDTVKSVLVTLVSLAQQQLRDGDPKSAVDLLRAGEHLAFASLASGSAGQSTVSGPVKDSIDEEFRHLTDQAAEYWGRTTQRHSAVASLYNSSVKSSRRSFL
jgi:hypothetical protein